MATEKKILGQIYRIPWYLCFVSAEKVVQNHKKRLVLVGELAFQGGSVELKTGVRYILSMSPAILDEKIKKV